MLLPGAVLPALAGSPAVVAPAQQTVPRTILALVDLREESTIRLSRIHTMAELPLNHLGLSVVYWNVADGLPDLSRYPDLRGVVTWFTGSPSPMSAPMSAGWPARWTAASASPLWGSRGCGWSAAASRCRWRSPTASSPASVCATTTAIPT
ncbi:hypothetical protein ABNQ39_23600 [Azospirillum sp. A26]|uniref:hypothetical protein n=1 Tax=Azospirillum sp. A26 TaxID=3160607 RepID=UPI00366D92FB